MTTLLQHLSDRSDDELRLLFRLRPDLCIPGVADFSALATRASTQMSVLRALERLNEPQLQALSTAVVHGQDSVSLAELAALLAPDAAEHEDELAATVAELVERVLLLPAEDERWNVPGPVHRALGTYPAELGRPAAVLGSDHSARSREEIRRRIVEHPSVTQEDDAARVQRGLELLAHSPVARVPDPAGAVLTVLLDTGILVRVTEDTAELPRETGLALRGGTLFPAFSIAPPTSGAARVLPMLVNNAAAAAISDLLRGMTHLVRAASSARGVPTLRSGGVGVREVQQLARRLDADVEDTTWLLELAAAADVIALNPDTSRWESRYTTALWGRLPRHRQWHLLAAGWLSSQRAPFTAPLAAPAQQRSSSASGATPGRALAPDRARADAPRLRQGLLDAAADLDARHPGTAVVNELETFRRWQHPRSITRTQAFTTPLAGEAERLGLFGAQALTSPGRALAEQGLEGLDAAADAVAELLPAPIRTLRLQADLTAVAPGFLDPELAAHLERFADDEGDGTAAVFRFSAESVRRGLDDGLTAEAMLELLAAHSSDALPQTLRYLIDDTARRHLALAVHRAGAVLTVEEPATLTTLLAMPELAPAGLQRLSDTIALSRLDDAELHALLAETGRRAARRGHHTENSRSPLIPGPGGAAVPTGRVTPASGLAVTVASQQLTEDDIEAQIRHLRTAPTRPTPTGEGPEELIAGLTEAAAHRRELSVTTANHQGAHVTRRLLPTAVGDGRLRGRDLQRDTDVIVPLHRVVSAVPVHPAQPTESTVPAEEHS
ncbi:helicase-associated domain-containing protein [Citricoccus muralis]|uniref:Helicase-associated domain-containing protein n=1 Tax=Citricoccus muralis TaxID=169134 RepID=A0ABY8H9H6_9MICC|nr:helicase-associated domain-containing protein [Citricoccus muralis]WFP17267.1 helicase-associated domain-containing protein [Citricoccus muralis]